MVKSIEYLNVNVLSTGCTNPNGCAFVYPLIRFQSNLLDAGLRIKFVLDKEDAVRNCDVLLVENKFFSARWATQHDGVLEELFWLKDKVGALIYVDITDSSGWDHADALPIVSAYLKNQLLVDRTRYLQPMSGYRPFTDYYHTKFAVEDNEPNYSCAILDPALLRKLGVGWNSGFADWSLYGPMLMALYNRSNWKSLLMEPKGWTSPSTSRINNISCRFGVKYARETVAWQRKKINELMKEQLGTQKLSRRSYFKELRNSKLIVSPFGLGEITLKDFEVFITGGLLYKPDMSHMETWSNLFVDGETMVAHRWDLNDFQEKIDMIIGEYDNYVNIAYEGQRRYKESLIGKKAGQSFARHLHELLTRDWEKPWMSCDR